MHVRKVGGLAGSGNSMEFLITGEHEKVITFQEIRRFHKVNKILVSKETMVLRRWKIETEIDFIKRVDKGRITTVKYLESS